MSFFIYVVSWFIALFIHINTLKRTSLTNTKDSIIKEIDSLQKIKKDENDQLVIESITSHKFSRIESKVKEFNSICKTNVISTTNESFTNLFTFDIANEEKRFLTEKCYDAIEYVDRVFHEKIQSKYSFFFINRYEIAGTVSTTLSLYLIVKLTLWLFGNDI